MIDFLKRLQVKSDPRVLAFAMAVTALAIALVLHKDLTPKEAVALLGAALISPSLLKEKTKPQSSDDDEDDDGGGSPGSGSRMKAVVDQRSPSDPPSKLDKLVARVRLRTTLILSAMVLLVMTALPGCKLFEGRDALGVTGDVLNAVQKACIFANGFMPRAKVAQWCEVADPYLDALDALLPSAKAAYAATAPAGAVPHPVVCASTNNGVECWEAPGR